MNFLIMSESHNVVFKSLHNYSFLGITHLGSLGNNQTSTFIPVFAQSDTNWEKPTLVPFYTSFKPTSGNNFIYPHYFTSLTYPDDS